MRKTLAAIAVMLLTSALPAGVIDQPSATPTKSDGGGAPSAAAAAESSVALADAVLQRARQFLGAVLVVPESPATATLETATGHPCPFLRDGDRYFEVRFGVTSVRLPDGRGESSVERHTTVTLSADAETVLRIAIVRVEEADQPTDEPTGASMTRQLGFTSQPWTRPTNTGRVALRDALGAVDGHVPGGVLQAARIIVYQVESRDTLLDRTRLLWSIDLRGGAPRTSATGAPVAFLNHLRHDVDTTSGRWIGADSIPQPDLMFVRQPDGTFKSYPLPTLEQPQPTDQQK